MKLKDARATANKFLKLEKTVPVTRENSRERSRLGGITWLLRQHCFDNFDEMVEALECVAHAWEHGIDAQSRWGAKVRAAIAHGKEVKESVR